MSHSPERSFLAAESLGTALAARQAGAAVLAGGTWAMRATLRGESQPTAVVSLHGIPELRAIAVSPESVTVGAMATHAAISARLRGVPGLEALADAAEGSANPAVRRAATLGGNLCTVDFAAADLVAALLALDAEVELASAGGIRQLALADFLADRPNLLASAILTHVHIPRDAAASAHARLPLRKAGDYPVAIVSVAAKRDGRLCIAVGSVEAVARRWTALEEALWAAPHAPARGAELARSCNDFQGRDGTEAEGWYRVQVLPALVRRALAALAPLEAAA